MDFSLDEILSNTTLQNDGCITWNGYVGKNGYGVKGRNYKLFYTHRIVASLVYGEPETKLEVLHSCDNRACCNPKHLSWGTRLQNVRDMYSKNRNRNNAPKGTQHGMSKLSEIEILEIRQLRSEGWILKDLAEKYGCTLQNIHLITSGKHWKEVTNA